MLNALLVLPALTLSCHATTARAATGRLEITVVDRDTGQPVPCRMHLRSAEGRPRRPRDRSIPFWHDHFAVPGKIDLALPLGTYTFELERGPEYVDRTGHFTINRFADDTKQVDLRRFVDMAADGWYSGDLDIRRPVDDIPLLMQADDLHVAQVTTWPNGESTFSDGKPSGEPLVRFDGNRFYHLMAGRIERAGGTLLLCNLAAPIDLAAAGPEHPPPSQLLANVREQPGAWVDLSKPFWWDLPALVAHRQIDSIQIAHSHIHRDGVITHERGGKPRDRLRYPDPWGNAQWSQDIYFHLLNCGLRIPPSAGSGSGDAPNPVGYNRMYVHVDGPLTYESWWNSLRAGKVTITNGPLLRPTVHGQLPGHTFPGEPGQTLQFALGLTLSTREPISYLEIIKNGNVEHSVRFEEYAESGRLPEVEFTSSGWFLLRAVTDLPNTYRFAMTGPYYVHFDYKPRISRGSAQFFLDWVYERARRIHLEDPARHREVIEYHRQARDFWRDLVDRANAE